MAWALRGTMSTWAQGSDNRPLVVLLAAAFPISLLSMVVTWLLYDRYSLPDDSALSIGLLGAVFVVLLDLFLLVYLVGGKLRERQFAVAVKEGLLLLGLGLLIAPLVGVLPWSMRWLWYSSPWVPFLLRALFAAGVIAMLVVTWKAPRERRRSTLELLAVWVCTFAINDDLVPWPLRGSLALLLIVGVFWKALAVWKSRRAHVSAAGSA
ncbi:MAG TPA: hypothetical protein VGP73_14115 [Thermoanaerobaculia bacterium]